jgi:CRP/FNR family transcriptional regulator, cyclic AMP receptor protein
VEINEIKHLLMRVSLFEGLSQDDMVRIFAKGLTMRIARDEVLFYQNTTGNQMYIVLAGKLGVFKNEKQIAELKTGDMCGEMALVSHESRSATVKAMENSLLLALSQTTIDSLLTKKVAVQLLVNIIRTLAKRLRDTNAYIFH